MPVSPASVSAAPTATWCSPAPQAGPNPRRRRTARGVLTISADSPEALRRNALQLALDIENSDAPLAQLCWSTNRIKASGKARVAISRRRPRRGRRRAARRARDRHRCGDVDGLAVQRPRHAVPRHGGGTVREQRGVPRGVRRGRRSDGAPPRVPDPRGHGRRTRRPHRVRPARDLRGAVCAGTGTHSARCRTSLAARAQHRRVRRSRHRRGVQPRRRLPAGRRPRPSHAAAACRRRHARGPCHVPTTSPAFRSISPR